MPHVILRSMFTLTWLVQVHDRMTEQVYLQPLHSFVTDVVPDPVYTVPLLAEGRAALERINADMGLAFDDWDLKFYTKLFVETLGRDPTNVELFDMAQSNSEHRFAHHAATYDDSSHGA